MNYALLFLMNATSNEISMTKVKGIEGVSSIF